MVLSRHVHPGKIALIALLGALGACGTLPTAGQSDTAAFNATVTDEATGAGVYFPPATSFETPDIRFGPMAGVGPQQRQMFADQVNLAASTSGRTVPIVAQAVGEGRDTLVFMYFGADGPMTPYVARGVLARLTSITRFAPAIAEMGLSSEFDIYNMASVLGFGRIIVTDGRDFAHEARVRES